MRIITTLTILTAILLTGCTDTQQKTAADTFTDQIIESLVYIDVSTNEYSQLHPWKRLDISQKTGYGCAVSQDKILTTAGNMLNAEYIKVKWARQTEYVQAQIEFIDYESDLCLLKLNTDQIKTPLTPVTFSNAYQKGAELNAYSISPTGTLITARAYLDTAKVRSCPTSYTSIINLIAANPSSPGAKGKLFCMNNKPIGIACKGYDNDIRLIPADKINAFLDDCSDGDYKGFGTIGFVAEQLDDPAIRSYLKLPEDKQGMLVCDVYTLGTGSSVLQLDDVILAIDSHPLNSYGRYSDPKYHEIMYHHLITSQPAGRPITFDVWREGAKQTLQTTVSNCRVDQMFIPYYSYSTQPEFIIVGGYLFQQLTAPYMRAFGEDMQSSVPPHLFNYYQQSSFKPTDQRTGAVVLSFVLPAETSLGYHNLGRIVVDTYNGKKINSIEDIIAAQKLNPDSQYDIVEFEQDYPTVVINRKEAAQTNMLIQQRYGVTKLQNTN